VFVLLDRSNGVALLLQTHIWPFVKGALTIIEQIHCEDAKYLAMVLMGKFPSLFNLKGFQIIYLVNNGRCKLITF
jgi:hypothetical protein